MSLKNDYMFVILYATTTLSGPPNQIVLVKQNMLSTHSEQNICMETNYTCAMLCSYNYGAEATLYN